jgi:hypothetical protein
MVYAFYAVSYVGSKRIPALQIVALFAMGLPGFLACASVWLKKEIPLESGAPVSATPIRHETAVNA